MADQRVEIPNRAVFKAAEVCEIAQIPPYVLRSWEKEFPRLGASARPGGPRTYSRNDIEQVLRIKQLVFAEGLTLAGARRKIEGDSVDDLPLEPVVADAQPALADLRARVAHAKDELRLLLDLLSSPAHARAATQGTRARRGGEATPASAGEADEPVRGWPPSRAESAEDAPLIDVTDAAQSTRRRRSSKAKHEDDN